MAKSTIRQQIADRINELECHLRDQALADKSPQMYEKALSMTLEMRKAFETGRLNDANTQHVWLRRYVMDTLTLTETLAECTNFLEKYLPILLADYRCPYCDGNLRSAKARQCPECLQDWHDPDNVKTLGSPR